MESLKWGRENIIRGTSNHTSWSNEYRLWKIKAITLLSFPFYPLQRVMNTFRSSDKGAMLQFYTFAFEVECIKYTFPWEVGPPKRDWHCGTEGVIVKKKMSQLRMCFYKLRRHCWRNIIQPTSNSWDWCVWLSCKNNNIEHTDQKYIEHTLCGWGSLYR